MVKPWRHVSRKHVRKHVFRFAIAAHLMHASVGLVDHIFSAESYIVATVSLAEVMILTMDTFETRDHEAEERAPAT
jgi:hypothetical protein